MMQDFELRYPIGRFRMGPAPDPNMRLELLGQLAQSPAQVRAVVAGLAESRLDTPYRLGGWTVRQVVHHLADAQMNWYIRTKFALTEIEPVIKPFDEATWAELPDSRSGPVEPSLDLLDGLIARWVELLQSLTEDQWKRKMIHPDRGVLALDTLLPMHVWHMRHHTAHITELRKRLDYSPVVL